MARNEKKITSSTTPLLKVAKHTLIHLSREECVTEIGQNEEYVTEIRHREEYLTENRHKKEYGANLPSTGKNLAEHTLPSTYLCDGNQTHW